MTAYTFESTADEKDMVRAVLDAPLVIACPDHYDLCISVTDEHRAEVIEFLNSHMVKYLNYRHFIRVIDKPSRLYKSLTALVERFPFFIYM